MASDSVVGESQGGRPSYEVQFSARNLLLLLSAAAAFLLVVHAALTLYHYLAEELPWLPWRQLFDVDEENNLPTWFSGFLLSVTAVCLWLCSRRRRAANDPLSPYWYALTFGFLFLWLGEIAGLHETVNSLIDSSWAIAGGFIAALVGLGFVRFLRRLPTPTSRLFVAGGALYVGGAVGVELIGQPMDADRLLYNLTTVVEEGMEIAGVIVFLYGLLRYMKGPGVEEAVAETEPAARAAGEPASEPAAASGWAAWRWRFLDRPVDNASIVFFRVAFGAIMLWEVFRYFDHGWIPRYWIEPAFLFPYEGFEWVRPWPGDGMYYHFYALGLLAILIAAGLWYRVAAVLFFLGFTYIFLLCQTRYLNHFYLISLLSFLMIFIPAHRSFSLDAWRRPGIRSHRIPAWTLWLLRAQLGIVYFYGGVAKLNADWFRAEPIGSWMASTTDFPVIGSLFGERWMAYGFAAGGLLLDLLIVPFLLWPRTRIWAFGVATLFHLMNAQLFSIGIFPWFMIAATLLFFEPDWPIRFFDIRRRGLSRADRRQRTEGARRLAPLATGLLAGYVALQLLVPLRHFLYPGNVSWTEEGHRFSWHMKLRDKDAYAAFHATDPDTGRTWEVDALDYVTPRQEGKMATRPVLIYQLAQQIAADLRSRGHERIEIRAEVEASLNGREFQHLIDPEVDLAALEWSYFAPKEWILPLEQPLLFRPGDDDDDAGFEFDE